MRSLLLTPLILLWCAGAKSPDAIDPAQVARWEALLPEKPCGVGRPIDDRQAWDAMAKHPAFHGVVAEAEKLRSSPVPELPDELFRDYSQTGNRTRYQKQLGLRHGRLPTLVLAECLENQGRFLPAIETLIDAICDEKTWVLPAHDGKLANFEGRTREIDLHVAGESWELATARWWLGARLSDGTRQRIADELERRTFEPFRSAVTQGTPRLWWLTGTNNWNAVCMAGTVGSALATVQSRSERAFFCAAAQHYLSYFLSGFTADGYCSEGLGYWNYGFGHYVLLAETLKQATGREIDLMDDPHVAQVARFGPRMEILPGLYPAFADCGVSTRPTPRLMAFLSRRYGWGLKDWERSLGLEGGPGSSLFELGVMGFENSASGRPSAHGSDRPPRDWFSEAGILIARPASPDGLGVALKGGHNAEHHNHNDVGSFVVTLAGGQPILDPGSEVYTARTFSSNRYESKALNSFGHPVPRVAGSLQRTGREAQGKVLEIELTDARDTLRLDLASAYDVKPLRQLTRRFVYDRSGRGSLTVADEVRFDSPQDFGTALVTYSPWKQLGPARLRIGKAAEAVDVTIDSGGQAVVIREDKIDEDMSSHETPLRIGIDWAQPAAEGRIQLTITPAGGE